VAAAHLVSLPSFLQCFFVFVFWFCHTLKHIVDLVIDLVYGWFLCRFSSLCCCCFSYRSIQQLVQRKSEGRGGFLLREE
jgi:hypothetical protein